MNSEIALLRSYGHEVELYRRHNDELNRISPGIAAAATIWSKQSADELSAKIDVFQPDLIHVHNTFPLISPSAYWIAARKKIPVVQTLHNFRLLCPQGAFLRNGKICEECIGKIPWRAVVRKCYRNSLPQSAVLTSMLVAHRAIGTYRNKIARYIVLNTFCRDRFIEGGLPAEQLRVKPNFVESKYIPDWGARRGAMFVGRLSPEKGIDTLIEAVRINSGKNVSVIGSGPYERRVAENFGEQYLGFMSRDDIMFRMCSALYLLVPSVGYENSPCTIMEAFSCGLPVIASRLGPLTNIIQDGVTGLLFNPGD
ncbi:MAG: glycosyltransferase, partial [Herminiimonas sp.]|nr:glycosyltransferase [Herminiimonas sp.]